MKFSCKVITAKTFKYKSFITNLVFLSSIFLFPSLKANLLENHINNESIANEYIFNENNTQSNPYEYILGAGDLLQISFLGIPELSQSFSIGPNGTVFLPRLGNVKAEGITLKEFNNILTNKYKEFIKKPILTLQVVNYRDIKIFIGGEVKRPGYYTLKSLDGRIDYPDTNKNLSNSALTQNDLPSLNKIEQNITPRIITIGKFPTLFDAIRKAEGITSHSKLDEIKLVRRLSDLSKEKKIQTNLNILKLITLGDASHNIRLYDGDVVVVKKSNRVLLDQIIKASKTNINPSEMNIYVTGRVTDPGNKTIPQGSVLNQAIGYAGGPKFLKGSVEFLRFSSEGLVDRRIFRYNPKAKSGSFNNPILMSGDVIRIKNSPISATTEVLGEVSAPIFTIFSISNLFDN